MYKGYLKNVSPKPSLQISKFQFQTLLFFFFGGGGVLKIYIYNCALPTNLWRDIGTQNIYGEVYLLCDRVTLSCG